MNLFEVVKANINTQEAAQTYGIDVNHYGRSGGTNDVRRSCYPYLPSPWQYRSIAVDRWRKHSIFRCRRMADVSQNIGCPG